MNVVFIGSSKFGERCLRAIIGLDDIQVVGCVTAPKEFSISYSKSGVTNVLHADVADICDENNIPFVTIADGMKGDALFKGVEAWEPDLFIVAGWYHMVPKRWRALAPAYGLHASILPDYSGGAPLVWAIINGETETGITLFQFDDGVDSGPIVGQARTPIYYDDTIATVYSRIEELGLDLINECLPQLAQGNAEHRVQDESLRRLVPQRKPADGVIDFNLDAEALYNFIRAQTKPYPGAFFVDDRGRKITIWAAQVFCSVAADQAVGQLYHRDNSLLINCNDGSVLEICALAVDDTDIEVGDFIRTHLN